MREVAMRHAANDGVFIGLLRELRHEFADHDPVDIRLDWSSQRAAKVVTSIRLGIERINVTWPTPHPDLND